MGVWEGGYVRVRASERERTRERERKEAAREGGEEGYREKFSPGILVFPSY